MKSTEKKKKKTKNEKIYSKNEKKTLQNITRTKNQSETKKKPNTKFAHILNNFRWNSQAIAH